MPSSFSSGFLPLVSTVSDTSRPQLVSSIKFHKLWCKAKALLLPVLQAGKMLTSKWICYLPSHPGAFGSQASSPSDNITLNPAIKRTDQSLPDFPTGICEIADATLDTENLISYMLLFRVLMVGWLQLLKYVKYQDSWHSRQYCLDRLLIWLIF